VPHECRPSTAVLGSRSRPAHGAQAMCPAAAQSRPGFWCRRGAQTFVRRSFDSARVGRLIWDEILAAVAPHTCTWADETRRAADSSPTWLACSSPRSASVHGRRPTHSSLHWGDGAPPSPSHHARQCLPLPPPLPLLSPSIHPPLSCPPPFHVHSAPRSPVTLAYLAPTRLDHDAP
jgi:hypothetical protein